jgi:hypothetical protein
VHERGGHCSEAALPQAGGAQHTRKGAERTAGLRFICKVARSTGVARRVEECEESLFETSVRRTRRPSMGRMPWIVAMDRGVIHMPLSRFHW